MDFQGASLYNSICGKICRSNQCVYKVQSLEHIDIFHNYFFASSERTRYTTKISVLKNTIKITACVKRNKRLDFDIIVLF